MENHLVGLPEHGVLLTGSLENPVIENRSGRAVITYRLKTMDRNGHELGPLNLIPLAFSMQRAGIPDGGATYVHGNVPVNLAGQVQVLRPFQIESLAGPMQGPARGASPGQGPIVRATLQCVIFADGQFVGEDEQWIFEHFGRVIKTILEVGLSGKAGAWDQLEPLALSSGSQAWRPLSGEDTRTLFERRLAATFLVQERKQRGDAAAAQLAGLYSSLPELWR